MRIRKKEKRAAKHNITSEQTENEAHTHTQARAQSEAFAELRDKQTPASGHHKHTAVAKVPQFHKPPEQTTAKKGRGPGKR